MNIIKTFHILSLANIKIPGLCSCCAFCHNRHQTLLHNSGITLLRSASLSFSRPQLNPPCLILLSALAHLWPALMWRRQIFPCDNRKNNFGHRKYFGWKCFHVVALFLFKADRVGKSIKTWYFLSNSSWRGQSKIVERIFGQFYPNQIALNQSFWMTRESSRDGPLRVRASCRVHKGTGLDDNNRNLKSFPIHCNVHDNPLIEPGEMQYYAKIEGTDRFTNHDSNLKGIHPWVNSIFAANNIPSLKSVSYTPRPKPINTPQCNCSLYLNLMCSKVATKWLWVPMTKAPFTHLKLIKITDSCCLNCDLHNKGKMSISLKSSSNISSSDRLRHLFVATPQLWAGD